MLKPSPLAIGDLFSASFNALKMQFGLFLLLALFPTLFIVAVVVVTVVLMVPVVVAATQSSGLAGPGFAVAVVVFVLGTLAGLLLQYKSYAMMSVATYEIAQGQTPDFKGVWTRTKGFLAAMAGVFGIIVLALVVVNLAAVLFVLAVEAISNQSGSGAAAALAVSVSLMLLLAAYPIVLFLTTKFLYTVPSVAIEGIGGVEGLKRSWTLTRGAFWRTLGYYILAALAVSAATYLVGQVSQVVTGLISFPFLPDDSYASDPIAALSLMVAMIPAMLLLFGVQMVVGLVTTPFLQAYTTHMYIDQVRRSEMPTVFAHPGAGPYGYGGYYGQPARYPYPGTQHGQPAQPPLHGWPDQYLQPGPQYGTPGHVQPGGPPNQPGQFQPRPAEPTGQTPQPGAQPPQYPGGPQPAGQLDPTQPYRRPGSGAPPQGPAPA